MMSASLPLLSIVGTTSVGKSEAVFKLAATVLQNKLASGITIISADSRQVYRGLETITGADVPPNFTEKQNEQGRYFEKPTTVGAIKLYGVSVIEPTQEWSVSNFITYTRPIITAAQENNELVVIVGGTGLYHQQLLATDSQLFVPPNPGLRQSLAQMSVVELQNHLEQLDSLRLTAMNNSDRHNPRRLVRAIELARAFADSSQTNDTTAIVIDTTSTPHHFVGLQLPSDELQERIAERVAARFHNGAVQEVAQLLKLPALAPQISTTLGFTQVAQYLAGEVTKEVCVTEWAVADFQYSKRQLTWWNKYGEVTWFSKTDENWYTAFETHVTKILTQNQ